MKKIIGIIIFVLIIVLGAFVAYVAINLNKSYDTSKVTIIEYKAGTNIILNQVNIIDTDDIEEINNIYNMLEISPTREINLALLQNVKIMLDDNRVIYFMFDTPDVCSYDNGNETIAYVSTPDELIEWINKVLKK